MILETKKKGWNIEDFLTAKEETELVEAIRMAENQTSGEIRVHLEPKAKKEPFERAKEVFNLLGMEKTHQRNGVLVYVAIKDQILVILGDQGINNKVAPDFWEHTKDIIISHFKEGRIKQGLVDGILMAGQQLKEHFPLEKNDNNELSDEISTH